MRTMACSKVQYWDDLLQSCKSCRLVCRPLKVKACADFCRSMDCSRQVGSYYDNLLRDCINCSSVCGQHPTECQPFCPGTKPWPPSESTFVGKQDTLVASLPAPAPFQDVPCRMDLGCDPQVVVYLVLGLCLCTLLFSLLLTWTYFRKRGEEEMYQASTAASHTKGGATKDGLMEAGSRSSGSQTPEPIETYGFCFPDASPAVQETWACPRTYHFGMQEDAAPLGTMGAIPAPEDGHFQIICSPSQEKVHMT